MKRILYILSGNISTTPRALQSILTAQEYYDIEILCVDRNIIWRKIDNKLIKEHNLKIQEVSLGRKPVITWLINTILQKLSLFFYPILRKQLQINAYASSKASLLLVKKLKSYKRKYDLVIGHSYGSLYPVYRFSLQNKVPFIFDLEDYHPAEVDDIQRKKEKNRRVFLMKKILPKADFITYASPLIGEYGLKLLESTTGKNMLINNCFSKNEFQFSENKSKKIKFVWFSQNIGRGRGLETVIPVLEKFKEKIELSLIGNIYPEFEQNFLHEYSDFIKLNRPLPQKELNLLLSQFDIGLAIESSKVDFNRQICLTNKIWAYTQAGLYVLATNTQAQVGFIEENENVGELVSQNQYNLMKSVEKTIDNIDEIRNLKRERYESAQQLAWENEKQKLINIWNNIL